MTAWDRSAARARCDAANPEPWSTGLDNGEWDGWVLGGEDDPIATVFIEADAAFIVHARSDLPAALDAIDAVLALHQPAGELKPGHHARESGYTHWCLSCGDPLVQVAWPCPTAAALGVSE